VQSLVAQGQAALLRVLPRLVLDTLRETCPECGRKLTDTDIRSGWTSSLHNYTTTCPYCPPAVRPRFVARFSVTCDLPTWRGTVSNGPGALLFVEYLPPAVLVKELQSSIVNGQFGRHLLARRPVIFMNLLLWFGDFQLPMEMLVYLCEPDEGQGEGQGEAQGGKGVSSAPTPMATPLERVVEEEAEAAPAPAAAAGGAGGAMSTA
jgi:hypothetical protein